MSSSSDSPYEVFFSDVAALDVAALGKQDREKVLKAAERMVDHPFAGASKLKYVSVELWRKKLGRVRILFTVDKDNRRVIIRVIDLRDDDTYDKRKMEKSMGWSPPTEK